MKNVTRDNPIRAAVAPQKADAMDRAEKYANQTIEVMVALLAAHGWDLTKAAPYPSGTMRRADYIRQKTQHNFFKSLTADGPKPEGEKPWSYPGKPCIVQRCPILEGKFIEDARMDAAAQYEAFVAKLVEKIGPCVSAKLEGSHVWGYSILTVEKLDGSINVRERWKTQQIVNVSCLGKVFNQWPTRKMKV
jgi:hypothetical protein